MRGEAVTASSRGLLAPAGRADAGAVALFLVLGMVACLRLGRGFFLADDFVQLANSAAWDARGVFWQEVLARFAGSVDGVNGFYRPLTFVTFAFNYVMGDAQAGRWLGVNLALHLASAVLVGAIVARLSRPVTHAGTIAAIGAAVLFFAFAPAWEVAVWVSCRYDGLATFFTLATGLLVLSGRVGWALAATVAALLSKESGAGAILFAGIGAVLAARERAPGTWIRAALRIMAPWIVLGLAYAALRWMLFGSVTEVYRGVHPQLLSAQHWATLLSTGAVWARELFPGFPGVRGLLIGSAVVLAAGLWLGALRGRAMPLLAMLAMTVLTAALLLPHMTGFEPSGIGGRLFYQSAAFYAAAVGLATHEALASSRLRGAVAALACAFAAALLAANIAWGVQCARGYVEAQWSMRDAARSIAALATDPSNAGFDLVIVPDTMGHVPFGRNAQAGLMLPPVQAADYSRKLLVQTDAEIASIDRSIDGGVLSALRELGLLRFMETPGTRAWARLAPSRYLCWDPWRRRLVALPLADMSEGRIGAELARAYAASDCAMRPANP